MPKKLFTATASIILTLILLELLIRTVAPQITLSDITVHFDFRCFTKGDYYWIDLLPNRRCTLTPAAKVFPVTQVNLNRFGLRGPDITVPKPPDTKRLLFIGDSFFFGWGVEEPDTLITRTADTLRPLIPYPIDTVNAGLPASGPSYYYMFLKNEATQFDPDIVIVGFYLRNDVTENILHSQWTETDSQGLPLKTTSSIYYVDPVTHNLYPDPLPFKYRVPGLRNSHLFIAITNRLIPYNRPRETFLSNQICFYKRSCHYLDEAKAKTQQLFLAMKQITTQRYQKLLVVFIPSLAQFISGVDFIQTGLPIALSPQEKNYPYQQFIDFFTVNNIDYLDLRDYLSTHDPLTAYYAADPHWNPRGHQLAAEAISQKLLEYLKD
ncbi:MAG: SGNH/GDSL hydrolase family protein [Candidatus Chisholmbacteria bacterium]|nr:SGNH/GDSL hydrolase family protein [Candidatus Chisholmbacteria bacterium]